MQTEIVSSPAPSTMHNNIDSRARELADIVLRGILQTQTLLPRDASNFNANPPQFRSPHNPLDISSCCPINPPAFPSPIPASCADQNEEWVHELLPALPFVTSTTDKLDVGQRPEITKFSQDAVITQPTCRMAKMSWNPSVNNSFASATLHNPTDRIGSSCMDDPYTSKTTPCKTSSWKADGFGAAHEHSEPAFSEPFGTFPAFESFGIEHIPELLEVNKSNPSSSDNNSMAGASTSEQMDDDGFNTSNEAASANLFLRPGEVLPSQCAGTIPPGTVMGHPCQRTSCLPAMESTTFTMLPGFVGMSADQAPIDSSSLKASPNLFPVQSNPLFSTIASSICDKASMKELVYRAAAFKPIDTIMEGMISKKKRKNVRISKDPQSVAARRRRERISYRIAILQRLVPGGTKMDTASMLDEAINYLKFLKMQVQSLERMEKWLSKMYWNHLFPGSHNNYVYNNNCNMNNDFFNNNDNLYDIAATTTKTLSSTGTRAESTTATTRSATALHKNSAVTTATTTTTSS